MSDSDDLITDLARRVRDKYYGKYRGFVASNKDPDQLGRLHVRLEGAGLDLADPDLDQVP